MTLKGKRVFITGASSGIGLACAEEFAKAGAHLLLCSRRVQKLEVIRTDLVARYGIDVYAFELDVRSKTEVEKQIHALPGEWQAIDVLVNNAGLAAGLDFFQEGALQDWEEMIDTNVKGLMYVTREVLPGMIERHQGHIINIGSIAGHMVYPKGAVYCASKHAVGAITKGLREDLLGTGIRTSTVDPGAVETNFSLVRFKGDATRAAAVYQNMTPLSAGDVADAVVYCASRPPHVNISEIIVMPTDQASVTRAAQGK